MAANSDAIVPDEVRAQCEKFQRTFHELRDEIGKVIVGHREIGRAHV